MHRFSGNYVKQTGNRNVADFSAVTIIDMDIDIAIYFRDICWCFGRDFPSSDLMLCIDVRTVQGLIKIRGLMRTHILGSTHL